MMHSSSSGSSTFLLCCFFSSDDDDDASSASAFISATVASMATAASAASSSAAGLGTATCFSQPDGMCVCVLILAHSSKRIFVSFMHKTTRARIFLVCEKNTCTFCGQTWVYESTTLCGGQNHLKTMCSQRTASLLRQCILHGDKEAGRQLHRVASALLPGVLQEKVCCQQADCAFFLLERIWH